MNFLRAAVNARRLDKGEDEIDQLEFVKMVRAKAKDLSIDDEMLNGLLMSGFRAVRRNAMKFCRWRYSNHNWRFLMRLTPGLMLMR